MPTVELHATCLELHAVWGWSCPECGLIQFERRAVAYIENAERDIACPDQVVCRSCGSVLDVE
jgi:hypothetical protein